MSFKHWKSTISIKRMIIFSIIFALLGNFIYLEVLINVNYFMSGLNDFKIIYFPIYFLILFSSCFLILIYSSYKDSKKFH